MCDTGPKGKKGPRGFDDFGPCDICGETQAQTVGIYEIDGKIYRACHDCFDEWVEHDDINDLEW